MDVVVLYGRTSDSDGGIGLDRKYLLFLEAADSAGENPVLVYALTALLLLTALLVAALYGIQTHTVRIYNWNGRRFCYLGRTRLRRKGREYFVRIGERLADLSYTTLYQICPAREFVRRNRYRTLVLCAGEERCMLHVEACMRQSIYYRRQAITLIQ